MVTRAVENFGNKWIMELAEPFVTILGIPQGAAFPSGQVLL